MLKKIMLSISVIALLATMALLTSYAISKSNRIEELNSGSQVAYTTYGPVEYRIIGDKGPYVLYFHPVLNGYDSALFPPSGTRVIVPSRPGYLNTPIGSGYSAEAQASVLAALLDELKVDSVVAYGAVAGSAFAITFAALFPDRTDGLITYAATIEPTNIPEDFQAPILFRSDLVSWALFSLFTVVRGPEATVRAIVSDPDYQLAALEDPKTISTILDFTWGTWPVSLRENGWRNDNKILNEMKLPISNVDVPTLILHGTDDERVPFENSEKLLKGISGSQFYAIEGGDHLARLNRAKELDAVITGFISNL